MDGNVTYHQQVSYCGKPRCRKCREGVGHGPYWYAYRTENGRTIRTYIGKELPPELQGVQTKAGGIAAIGGISGIGWHRWHTRAYPGKCRYRCYTYTCAGTISTGTQTGNTMADRDGGRVATPTSTLTIGLPSQQSWAQMGTRTGDGRALART